MDVSQAERLRHDEEKAEQNRLRQVREEENLEAVENSGPGETGPQGPPGETGPPINIVVETIDLSLIDYANNLSYNSNGSLQSYILSVPAGTYTAVTVISNLNGESEGDAAFVGVYSNDGSELLARTDDFRPLLENEGAFVSIPFVDPLVIDEDVVVRIGWLTVNGDENIAYTNLNSNFPLYKNSLQSVQLEELLTDLPATIDVSGDEVSSSVIGYGWWFRLETVDPVAFTTPGWLMGPQGEQGEAGVADPIDAAFVHLLGGTVSGTGTGISADTPIPLSGDGYVLDVANRITVDDDNDQLVLEEDGVYLIVADIRLSSTGGPSGAGWIRGGWAGSAYADVVEDDFAESSNGVGRSWTSVKQLPAGTLIEFILQALWENSVNYEVHTEISVAKLGNWTFS